MIKKALLKSWLLLLCMIAGVGSAWADDKTITLDYSSFGLTNSYAVKTATVDDFGFTVNQGYKGSGNTIQMNSSKGSGILYNTTAITGLKSIMVNVASGSKTYTITTGTSQEPTANTQTGTTGGTYNAKSGDTYFQLKVSGASYFSSIVITYDDAGSDLDDNDLALEGDPVELEFDLYDDSDAKVINYTTSSTGEVTIANSDYATFSIDQTAKTITVTPTAITSDVVTITVNQAADDTYKAGSTTFDLIIDDSTPVPTYTVTLGDDNSTLTEETGGAGVTLPSRDSKAGYAFAGWSETNVTEETTTAPTIIPAGSYTPTADITLYPVYKKTEGVATPNAFTVGNTGSYAVVAELSEGEFYALPTNPTINNGKITAQEITVSEINGVKYVTPANATGFTWTIATATNGYTLSDGSHYIYHSNGGNSGTNLAYGDVTTYTWSFTADGIYIKMAGMNGSTINGRGLLFSGATIGGYALSNWSSYNKTMILPVSEAGTTYYWSAPVAAAVERPEIVVAENPFVISTTATITCETEGAAIKYSFNGEDWNNYEDALTITTATTLYAKAVKNEVESSVASVEIIKNLATPTVAIATNITNTDVYAGTAAGSLAATVTYNNVAVEGAVVTWSGNNDGVATIDASTGAVTLVAAGSVTFTATYAGNSDYAEKTATYVMTVTNTDPNAPGTENNPYTVAQAIAATPASGTSENVYIRGIVSGFFNDAQSITSDNYHRYYISDGGTTDNQLLIFNGKGLNEVAFSSAADLQIGDVVTVYGKLTTYSNAPEVAKDNYIVSQEAPVTITDANFATFSSARAMDFSATGIKAYTGKVENDYVKLTEIAGGIVPAETGVILYAEDAKTYNVPVTTTSATITDNELVATLIETEVEWEDGTNHNYILQASSTGAVFNKATGAKLRAGKAYLSTPAAVIAARLSVVFEDEATGIASVNVKSTKTDGAYNLNGQRVAAPRKGLYIVNGKKVVVK
jgi:uncharacterized repeat protein (TIGR02543 family)